MMVGKAGRTTTYARWRVSDFFCGASVVKKIVLEKSKRLFSVIGLNIRAIVSGILFLCRRNPISASISLFAVFVTIFVFAVSALNPETPKQMQQEQDVQAKATQAEAAKQQTEQAEQDAAQEATDERNAPLCKQQSICQKYGVTRQECATAGNFDLCVSVKMGDDDFNEISSCNNDGSVSDPPDNSPSYLQCAILGARGLLK
jgi:hypothetical protein